MNCRQCGSQLGTWQLVCRNCGTHAPENTSDATPDQVTGNGNDPISFLGSLAQRHLGPRLKELAQEVMDPRARAQARMRRQRDAWRRQLEQQLERQERARQEAGGSLFGNSASFPERQERAPQSLFGNSASFPRLMNFRCHTADRKVRAYACEYWAHADQRNSPDWRWRYRSESREFRVLLEQERAVWEALAQGDAVLEAHMAEDRRYWEERDERQRMHAQPTAGRAVGAMPNVPASPLTHDPDSARRQAGGDAYEGFSVLVAAMRRYMYPLLERCYGANWMVQTEPIWHQGDRQANSTDLDIAELLWLLDEPQHNALFSSFPNACRGKAGHVRFVRNLVYHHQDFTVDQVHSALDAAAYILRCLNERQDAQQVETLRDNLPR